MLALKQWLKHATSNLWHSVKLNSVSTVGTVLRTGDATQVQNAEIWADLINVIKYPATLKQFFKDYCKTDVVESPLAELYHDAMSVSPEQRAGKLLVCRDQPGHAEPAIEYVPVAPPQCWTVVLKPHIAFMPLNVCL